MADNYRSFSEVVPALDAEQQAWAAAVLAADVSSAALAAAGIDAARVDLELWPGFSWQVLAPAGDLWLYSDEADEVAHVAEFVRAFLARFRPADTWRMTWADTCSRPRVGEFSGGAAFVTAAATQFHTPEDWLDQREAEASAAAAVAALSSPSPSPSS